MPGKWERPFTESIEPIMMKNRPTIRKEHQAHQAGISFDVSNFAFPQQLHSDIVSKSHLTAKHRS